MIKKGQMEDDKAEGLNQNIKKASLPKRSNKAIYMNWILTIFFTISAYNLFSLFGVRSGQHDTFWRAALSPISNWIDFLLILFGSIGFGLATFYGARSSTFATSIVIALGVVVSYGFSVWFADGVITTTRLVGVGVILLGVCLIR